MTRIRFLLVAVFAAVTIAGAAAQAFSASYLDGSVDLKTAKGWKALAIGTRCPQTQACVFRRAPPWSSSAARRA